MIDRVADPSLVTHLTAGALEVPGGVGQCRLYWGPGHTDQLMTYPRHVIKHHTLLEGQTERRSIHQTSAVCTEARGIPTSWWRTLDTSSNTTHSWRDRQRDGAYIRPVPSVLRPGTYRPADDVPSTRHQTPHTPGGTDRETEHITSLKEHTIRSFATQNVKHNYVKYQSENCTHCNPPANHSANRK